MTNSPSAHQQIYSAKANVVKGEYYHVWPKKEGELSTWSVTDRAQHVWKRRVLSNAFSDRAVRSAEQYIIRHVDRACELLLQDSGNTWSNPRNIASWSEFLVFDILTDLCFGKSFEIKEPGENELKDTPNQMAAIMALLHPVCPLYALTADHYHISADTPVDWKRPVPPPMALAQTSRPRPPFQPHHPSQSEEILRLRRDERNRAQQTRNS